MSKAQQSPGTALTALLKKHQLNYNRLAKAIGLSSAMVRLIARDENPVSASVAFRLAHFFKTTPAYWLSLQVDFDITSAALNKKLTRALKEIPTVDTAVFTRKPKAASARKPAAGKKAAPKKAASKKAGARKAAAPKKTAAKKAAVKPAAKKAAAPRKAAVKKAMPAKAMSVKTTPVKAMSVKTTPAKTIPAKVTPEKAPAPVIQQEKQPPVSQPLFPEMSVINEPQL